MSHRSRRRRRQIATVAIVVGSVALLVAAINLVGGSPDAPPTSRPSATATAPHSQVDDDPTPPENNDASVAATDPPPTAAVTSLSEIQPDAFSGATTTPRRHTVTMTITTDSPLRYAYWWRDKDGPGEMVTDSKVSVSRTFVTALPAGEIVLQLTADGGRATCTVVVDGVTFKTYTAEGAYRVAMCWG